MTGRMRTAATIAGLCLVVALAVAAFVYVSDSKTKSTFDGSGYSNVEFESERIVPAGMREYQSATYRFSLLYPENLSIKEYDEGRGAGTVTFQDASRGEGFQIFIAPYREKQITEERFLLDNPSGAMEEPVEGLLDGALASMFFSTDPLLGDTREIWFIKDGYLYEVTTLKVLDKWLEGAMLTWRFIQ